MSTIPMSVIEVGSRLVELTRADKDEQALAELYADKVESVEAGGADADSVQTFSGIDAVREKHAWWNQVATLHASTAEGPYAGAGDNHFVVKFWMDITMEGQPRSEMTEVGLYTVVDGKIVREVYLENMST